MANETNIKVLKVEVDVQSGKVSINGLTNGFVKAETAVKSLNKEIQNTTTKGLNPMIDKTGLAGAAVVEIGRTISDSNYGIRGMANNLSQLATLMTTLIVTTKGVANGFRALWSAFMGPLGLIVVFQTLVALFERSAIDAEKSSEKMNSMSKSAKELSESVNGYLKALNNVNISEKEREVLLSRISSKSSELKDIVKDNKDDLKLLNDEIKTYIKVQSLRATLDETIAKASKAQDKLTEQAQIYRSDNVEQMRDYLAEAGGFWPEWYYKFSSKVFYSDDQIRRRFKDTADFSLKESDALAKSVEKILLELANLEDNVLGEETNKKLNDFIEKWRKKRLESEAASKADVLEIQRKAALEEAVILKAGKETILNINRYYDSEIFKSRREEQKKLIIIAEDFYEAEIENLEQYIKRRRQVEKNGKKADKYLADEAENERQARLSKAAAAAQAFGAILSGLADNIDAAYQKELDIEQNRTSQLNNQLRERLANEQLSADERKNIQNQIAKNDEELRKKQDEIEKKRFKANKAAAIAEATVNTFLAATGVLAQTKGGTFERIAGMIAVIGAGLAQVAMISKQQFVSSQSSISAGSGVGGGGVQSPDFNIVGQSASNQLAEAVKGQLSQPIKTYVVSKDVSTAQEMERNIIGSASLG